MIGRRTILQSTILWLSLAACTATVGGNDTTAPAETSVPSTTGLPASTQPAPVTTVPVDPNLAPDFTLELADGGRFTLSESDRPVYIVFWAEWCPVCRRELPVVDTVAADYADRVHFVAPAWKSGEEAARQVAADLFESGHIQWGLDPDEVIFSLYGIPYQPVTILITADRMVVEEWAGVRSEQRIRESLDALISASETQGS